MSLPADRRERENVDAFLCELKSSAYQVPLRSRENERIEDTDSQILTESQRPAIHASQDQETANSQVPTFSPERARETVEEMVAELADDIDFAIGIGAEMPFAGADLRRHYADLLRREPVEVVLVDAKQRWRAQVIGDVLPLEVQDAVDAVIDNRGQDSHCTEAGDNGGA